MRTPLITCLALPAAAAGFLLSFGLARGPALHPGVPPSITRALGPARIERGTFHLYRSGQSVGDEHFITVHDAHGVSVASSVELTDHGSRMRVLATLSLAPDGSPRRFEVNATNSGRSVLDAAVTVQGRRATVSMDGATREVDAPTDGFAIAGYAPIAIRQELLRYWLRHGRPAALPVLPAGSVAVTRQGTDTIAEGGRRVGLTRYGIAGLVPATELIWLDDSLAVALAMIDDPDLGRFVAVRETPEGRAEGWAELAMLPGVRLRQPERPIPIHRQRRRAGTQDDLKPRVHQRH